MIGCKSGYWRCWQIPRSRRESKGVDLRSLSKFTLWILYHGHLQSRPPTVTPSLTLSALLLSSLSTTFLTYDADFIRKPRSRVLQFLHSSFSPETQWRYKLYSCF